MKKILLTLASLSLLAGCSMYSIDENEATETETQESVETEQESENIQTDVSFTLQESDRQAQVSPTNDDALRILSDWVYQSDQAIGEEGQVTVDYSGLYLNAADTAYGVFLITNRTDEAMTNISMTVDAQSIDGNLVLLSDYPVYLADNHFGSLEPDTAMPLYLELQVDEQTLSQADDGNLVESQVTIESYEEPDQADTQADQRVGYNPGYNPAYTLGILNQKQIEEDIASGNVPQLDLIHPPVIVNQLGENPLALIDEQGLNTARALMPENDFGLFWTGITQVNEETGQYATLFMLGNRTGEDLADFQIDMDFADTDGNVYVSQPINLAPEDYGTLTDQSIMPFFVEIPTNQSEAFQTLLDGETQPAYTLNEVRPN